MALDVGNEHEFFAFHLRVEGQCCYVYACGANSGYDGIIWVDDKFKHENEAKRGDLLLCCTNNLHNHLCLWATRLRKLKYM